MVRERAFGNTGGQLTRGAATTMKECEDRRNEDERGDRGKQETADDGAA